MFPALIAILPVFLFVAWAVARSLWTRFCPVCTSRHLRRVTCVRASGTTPESSGGFTFYRCADCGAALQRHRAGPVTVASQWRAFIIEHDHSSPTPVA